jgi:hypothetical protein
MIQNNDCRIYNYHSLSDIHAGDGLHQIQVRVLGIPTSIPHIRFSVYDIPCQIRTNTLISKI